MVPLVTVCGVIVAFVVMDAIRQVDSVEVFGVALFLVVAIGAMRSTRTGVVAGVLATLAYAVARRGAVDLAGSNTVNRLIGARAVGYLAFGGLGGLLSAWVRSVATSSEPARTLSPAQLAPELRREIDRAKRHHHPLAVLRIVLRRESSVAATSGQIGELSGGETGRRQPRNLRLRALDLTEDGSATIPETLHGTLRSSDLAAYAEEGATTVVTIVLPETDDAGAQVVVERLRDAVGSGRALRAEVATLATDPDRLDVIASALGAGPGAS
jgi:hypothetical protein